MKKYMRITDEVIAKRSYEYYSKLFSFPPLTDEKGIGVVLKFLATQPGGAGAKNAKAEEFFDNSLLQELAQGRILRPAAGRQGVVRRGRRRFTILAEDGTTNRSFLQFANLILCCFVIFVRSLSESKSYPRYLCPSIPSL